MYSTKCKSYPISYQCQILSLHNQQCASCEACDCISSMLKSESCTSITHRSNPRDMPLPLYSSLQVGQGKITSAQAPRPAPGRCASLPRAVLNNRGKLLSNSLFLGSEDFTELSPSRIHTLETTPMLNPCLFPFT